MRWAIPASCWRVPAKALVDGVELTERELLKVLEKNGVRKFDPHGAKFDPNLHQAMFEVPDANVPSGSVVQVVQPGYMLADRVLRPALVGVSKGGPRVARHRPRAGRRSATPENSAGPLPIYALVLSGGFTGTLPHRASRCA